MRKLKTITEQSSEVDMTPMLDIVFIMLIFFIVTTSFVKESAIEINRPNGTSKPIDIESKTLVITIHSIEGISINGRSVLQGAVQANIEAELSSKPGLSILVKVDENASSGVLVKVVDQARLAGIKNVTVNRLSS
jgi:biopolymer transport protein ExbD